MAVRPPKRSMSGTQLSDEPPSPWMSTVATGPSPVARAWISPVGRDQRSPGGIVTHLWDHGTGVEARSGTSMAT